MSKKSLDLELRLWGDYSLIRFNNQTNWIIFNAGSLSKHSYSSNEVYSIDSPYLRELLKEQIKTYHRENWKEAFHEVEHNNINDIEVKLFYWVRSEWLSISEYSWIAVNKESIGDGFGTNHEWH